jgi:NAD(P)-dependent dehydrogenase (short-subunit alcohol dehydrogenase family)
MSLSGANILITGATSGLGLAVSKRFARLGANTIVVGHTAPSAAAAVGTSYRQDADVRSRLWTTTEAMIERSRSAARR